MGKREARASLFRCSSSLAPPPALARRPRYLLGLGLGACRSARCRLFSRRRDGAEHGLALAARTFGRLASESLLRPRPALTRTPVLPVLAGRRGSLFARSLPRAFALDRLGARLRWLALSSQLTLRRIRALARPAAASATAASPARSLALLALGSALSNRLADLSPPRRRSRRRRRPRRRRSLAALAPRRSASCGR